MKAIVTGGAGFIGSHLCDLLIDQKFNVTAIDNFSKGSRDNIEHLIKHPNFQILDIDLFKESEKLKAILPGTDYIFHLAGYADIVPSIEQPDQYYENNVTATLNLLQAAREVEGLKKFCYAASSSCYGIPKNYPTSEAEPISTMYPYALTKYLGEELVLHWGNLYKLPVVSLRLFNVYGTRARSKNSYGAVLKTFLGQAANGKPLTIVGDGEQKRDFIYVTDVCSAFLKAAESESIGDVFNVGASDPKSINFLASLISTDIQYIKKRPGEPDQTYADITKIKNALKWEPTIDLKTGIQILKDSKEDWSSMKAWDAEEIDKETKSWFKSLS